MNQMQVSILSPEGAIYVGNAALVSFPGTKGAFTVLPNHAPIISSLSEGCIRLKEAEDTETEKSFEIKGGFVEVRANMVSVCVK